jgi:hypothetical protein
MANMPTMALFMSKSTKKEDTHSKRVKKQREKSMENDDTQCLAAVNYFRSGQDTVVLWLGTMLNKPPIESAHVTWRKCGFATYLLCLLIKQHTGILADMTNSVLSIQASLTGSKEACRFYQWLGFSRYILDDNGLSQTSHQFQSAVTTAPKLWISSSSLPMALFQLREGKINLPTLGKEYSNVDADGNFVYARFPFCAPSMKKLEKCIREKHVILFCPDKASH